MICRGPRNLIAWRVPIVRLSKSPHSSSTSRALAKLLYPTSSENIRGGFSDWEVGTMGGLGQRLVAVTVVLVAAVAIQGALQCEAVRGTGTDLDAELEGDHIPVKPGLEWRYYRRCCPYVERIVKRRIISYMKRDKGVAAGLLRLVFHDCFVQGCDASILLKVCNKTESELYALPNLTIRPLALQMIDDIKWRVECACPGTVSCADIVALAAKDAVRKTGGPHFRVPLGRKDSLWYSNSTADLPAPSASFKEQSALFKRKGLDTPDLVALAGAHTLGKAHCSTFHERLLPNVDPSLDSGYADYLKSKVCPTLKSSNATSLDFTPNCFDNQYYKNLPHRGLLCSDGNLSQNSTAWNLVQQWADGNQGQRKFFDQFRKSFIKMTQIGVLTGDSGEIRRVCSLTNHEKGVEGVKHTHRRPKCGSYGDSSETEDIIVERPLGCERLAEMDAEEEKDLDEAELAQVVDTDEFEAIYTAVLGGSSKADS